MIRAAEFFAGMGLMRAGLESIGVKTVFANDICPIKAALYRENWGSLGLHVGDIRDISGSDIPNIELATASFPCTDLSIAGSRKGLRGKQSRLILDFLRILKEMSERAPQLLLIENVPGFLTTNRGADWKTVMVGLQEIGYRTAHVIVNASAFVPQSRLRVFIVAHRHQRIRLPDAPPERNDLRLADITESDAEWWPSTRLASFLSSLSPRQERRVAEYQSRQNPCFFGAFRRTRNGKAVWEVRADEKSGALRTTRGGSAKQAILRAGGGMVAARWMSVTEYARLQGAGHMRYNSVTPQQAMFALGDAVCVPVVEWVAKRCISPIIQ